jgi:hypothetical protein
MRADHQNGLATPGCSDEYHQPVPVCFTGAVSERRCI